MAIDVLDKDAGTGSRSGIGDGWDAGSPEDPNNSPIGIYASFPYSPEPFAQLSDTARGALIALDNICTQTDTYARRMEVEQAWEALHFERGYQHLLRGKRGGWILPQQGLGDWGATSQKTSSTTYDTNIYGAHADITVAALSREVPKIEFFPVDPLYGPDKVAAEEADRFKEVWARNSNLHGLLTDIARMFCNEGRVLLWTRYVVDAQHYGYEGDVTEAPTVPQDELNPPELEPTGQDGLETVINGETSAVQTEGSVEDLLTQAGDTENRKPLGREVTTAHGKLDHKVPIAVDHMEDMQYIQLCLDLDVALVRGMFPWIADKINPGTDGMSETQLDRIARENVRQAVLGAYVTGDSLSRHTTVKYTWLRPSMFLDPSVSDEAKAELLEAFPEGCLLARAGQQFAFARNEKMDDHLVIGHPLRGKGQNRRTILGSLISIQKRINDWVDLMDDFFKRTVPKKWMNSEAFDMEAIQKQPNVPGSIGPFQVQPGLTTMDQYVFVEPTPQPQPALPDFIKYFVSELSQEISGALPSLFGAATGENTVGNAVIQRDQALQRIGCPWNEIQDMFAKAGQQAVKCAAECRDGKTIKESIKGKGTVVVNTANLLAGSVVCYAESNPAFPESWQQKETKLMTMVDKASANPALNGIIFSPSNSTEVLSVLRMKGFRVPGATSAMKQRNELELLLRNSPIDNPQFLQMQNMLTQLQGRIAQAQTTGEPVPPEVQPVLDQLTKAMQSTPPKMSSIQVAQDESENHAVEADECFEWMNSTEGQKFRNGLPDQQEFFENVHLHWQAHTMMSKKIQAANQPPAKPPSESISIDPSKMPPAVAVQALAKAGINATPDMFTQQAETELNNKVAGKAIPDVLKEPKPLTTSVPTGQQEPISK